MSAISNTATRHEVALTLGSLALVADAAGVLWLPGDATLVVADLHLEKGSAYAARGRGAPPPYDTAETLDRLAAVIDRRRPARVLCLGDSFHDRTAGARMSAAAMERLHALAAGRDWIWIGGNHDPVLPAGLPGRAMAQIELAGALFRHEAGPLAAGVIEVSGHFHPKATIRTAAGAFRRACFAHDARRLILPAFGAFTGGLDVAESVLADLFDSPPIRLVIDRGRIYRFAAATGLGGRVKGLARGC